MSKSKRKFPFLKSLLSLSGILLLAFLIFCVIFPRPSKTVDKFLRHLTNQRFHLAYEMTSLEFQENVDQKTFQELSEQLAVDSVKKYSISKGEYFKDSSPKRMDYEVTFNYPDFEPEVLDLKITKQGRHWLINIIDIDSEIYEQL